MPQMPMTKNVWDLFGELRNNHYLCPQIAVNSIFQPFKQFILWQHSLTSKAAKPSGQKKQIDAKIQQLKKLNEEMRNNKKVKNYDNKNSYGCCTGTYDHFMQQ